MLLLAGMLILWDCVRLALRKGLTLLYLDCPPPDPATHPKGETCLNPSKSIPQRGIRDSNHTLSCVGLCVRREKQRTLRRECLLFFLLHLWLKADLLECLAPRFASGMWALRHHQALPSRGTNRCLKVEAPTG